MSRKKIVILGSTGSIGTQTLDIVAEHPNLFEIVGLAAGSNIVELEKQMDRFNVRNGAVFQGNGSERVKVGLGSICELAQFPSADIVVVSVSGVIGLEPTIAAIQAKKDIALASKEVLVAAGELVMPMIEENGVKLTPIDSEHSAIFQCLQGSTSRIQELIITASGGPFRGKTRKDLDSVTVEQALNHPTWKMGGKITIDSATLMNKALETIEAKWLFDVPMESVSAVIHPQSIVHSFVKFEDGSVLGQLGWPNMKLPILYALTYPKRFANNLKPWNPVDTPSLSFEPIDHETFPALKIAKSAVLKGGTSACYFNALNEEAVKYFLLGKTKFLNISDIVEEGLDSFTPTEVTLANLLETDSLAREHVRQLFDRPTS